MADINVEKLKDFLVDMVVKQAMGILVTKVPWLFSFGPVGWATKQVLVWLVSLLVRKTILGANLLLVEIHIDGRVGEFEEILDKLKEAKTEEDQDALEKELIEASRGLIRFRDHLRLRTEDTK